MGPAGAATASAVEVLFWGEAPQASLTLQFSPFPEFPWSTAARSVPRSVSRRLQVSAWLGERPRDPALPGMGGGGEGPGGLPWVRNAQARLGSGVSREISPRLGGTDNGP